VANRGDGLGYRWLLDHRSYPHEEWCLIWPLFRHANGRGVVGLNGKTYRAHRMMCQLAHGEPPTPEHQAAHSCGNGHLGCANPKHLSWKTASENLMDCAAHGTHPKSRFGAKGQFDASQIEEIRELLKTRTHREIAEMFGANQTTIGNIATGRFYSGPRKIKFWTQEEDDKIRDCVKRGLSFREMANEIGRPEAGVTGRAYRLGLKSGRPATREDYSSVRRYLAERHSLALRQGDPR
jgi:hypothetical protein